MPFSRGLAVAPSGHGTRFETKIPYYMLLWHLSPRGPWWSNCHRLSHSEFQIKSLASKPYLTERISTMPACLWMAAFCVLPVCSSVQRSQTQPLPAGTRPHLSLSVPQWLLPSGPALSLSGGGPRKQTSLPGAECMAVRFTHHYAPRGELPSPWTEEEASDLQGQT